MSTTTAPVLSSSGPIAPPSAAAQSAPLRLGFRSDIEGLRGIAVLLVVLFHAGVPGVSGGFIGVDVFFVLSGYLITGLLWNEHARTGRIDLVGFYARRVRRLLPAALLTLLATVAIGVVVYSPIEQLRYARTATATAGYATNLWLVVSSADYFAASSAQNPFLHAWSLAVEEQFYLVWPLLMMFGLAGVARSKRRLAIVLGAVTLVSFLTGLWLTDFRASWAFYLTPVRAWEFGIGGLAALIPSVALARYATPVRVGRWLGLAMLALSAARYSEHTLFPGIAALLPAVATVLILLPGASAPSGVAFRALSVAPLQWIGKRSYAWYLWHWPILLGALMVWPDLPLLGRLIAGGVALVLSVISFVTVEHPVRSSRWLAARPRASLAMGGALTVVGIAAGLLWHQYAASVARSPAHRDYVAASQSTARLATPECMPRLTVSTPSPCELGQLDSDTVVVAMGDSHLAHWGGALDAMGKARGWRIVAFVKGVCSGAEIPQYLREVGRPYRECHAFREAAMQQTVALNPRGVILASRVPVQTGRDTYATEGDWYTGFRRAVSRWVDRGVPVVILRDTPAMAQNVPVCLSRATARPGLYDRRDCENPRAAAVDTVAFAAASRVAAELPLVQVVDFTDILCPTDRCAPADSVGVLYRDMSHLTTETVARIAPVFSRRVASGLVAR